MSRVFFFTDIHGSWLLFEKVLDYIYTHDAHPRIIFGGDACDRGEEGYKIMQTLLNNKDVIYLKGNHEDLFVNAAKALLKFPAILSNKESIEDKLISFLSNLYPEELCLSLYNGGLSTLTAWIKDGMPIDFINKINTLQYTYSYNNMDFCHSGATYEIFSRVKEQELKGLKIEDNDKKELLWNRGFVNIGWQKDRVGIFGHTPVIHLPSEIYGNDFSTKNIHPCVYKGTVGEDKWPGLKIDMDTGAIFTQKIFILNCTDKKLIPISI